MRTSRSHRRLCFAVGIYASFSSAMASDETREPVDILIPPWNAVGMVNTAAYGRCTGVLIGQNLAVTAAHCLYNRRTGRYAVPSSTHFVLGYNRGRYVHNTVVRKINVSADYDPLSPTNWMADWALIELVDPAPSSINPIKNSAIPLTTGTKLTAAGYAQDRAYALTSAQDCPFVEGDTRTVVARCALPHGYSGGPLFDMSGKLVGLTIATGKQANGITIMYAVRPDAWSGSSPVD